MKKNSTLFLLAGIIFTSIYGIFGCSPEIKDDDVITGKWIETSIILDSLSTECEKKSYIEFSEYKIDFQDRILSKFDACNIVDTVEGGTETMTITPYKEIIGNYSVYGDTLFVKDVNNLTQIYTIMNIGFDQMKLKTLDRDGNIIYMNYDRFKD